MTYLDFAVGMALKAGEVILKQKKKLTIETKSSKIDLVTNADKASEKSIISSIRKAFPDHGIIAEESESNFRDKIEELMNCSYIWIIDPLDGTTNFTHGLPHYCISIGLMKVNQAKKSRNFEYFQGELVAGVVYAPEMNQLFYAEKGKGAFLNNKKIHASKTKTLEYSLLATGFAYINKEKNIPYINAMIPRCRDLRRFGAAALDLCHTACGHFDGYWEFGLKPWDIAAGALIVAEAGGKVSDLNGNLLDLFGEEILCSNGKVHKEMVKVFSEI